MTEIRIQTTIENDGELYLRELPCRKGDRVSAVVTILACSDDEQREAARLRFLVISKTSTFRSRKCYPSRDELHGRD